MPGSDRDNQLMALRALLAGAPSDERFADILDLFVGWDDATTQVGIEYALEHLAEWPVAMRSLPLERVWPDFPLRAPKAIVRLLAGFSLTLSGGRRKEMISALKHDALSGIEFMELEGTFSREEDALALFGEGMWPNLRELRIIESNISDHVLMTITSDASRSQLASLHIHRCAITDASIEALAAVPQMKQLKELSLREVEVREPGIRAIARSPHLTQLEALHLESTSILDLGAQELSDSPNISGLKQLTLDRNVVSSAALARLISSNHIDALRSLTLCASDMEFKDFRLLIESPKLGHLEELHIINRQVQYRSAASLRASQVAIAVSRSSQMSKLRSLNLSGGAVGEKGLKALAETTQLGCLETLELADTGYINVPDDAVGGLFDSSSLPSLRSLNWSRRPLGPNGTRALLSGALLRQLKHLSLEGCELSSQVFRESAPKSELPLEHLTLSFSACGDEGLEALASGPAFSQLKALSCRYIGCSSRGVEVLASSFGQLASLDLSTNELGGGGLSALLQGALPRLTRLDVGFTDIDDDDLISLAASPLMEQLHFLDVSGNSEITSRGLKGLAASPSICNLRDLRFISTKDAKGLLALLLSPYIRPLLRLSLLSRIQRKHLAEVAAAYKIKGRTKMARGELLAAILERVQG